jgi:putative ABC transport system permease protein
VEYATGVVSGRTEVSFNGQNTSSSIVGIESGVWEQIQTVNLTSGRFLRQGDTNSVIIGSRVANSMFKKNITLNGRLSINGTSFVVAGILQQSGGFTQGGLSDNSIIMLKSSARNILSGLQTDQVSTILIKVSQSYDPNTVANNIQQILLIAHHVTQQNEDFTITSPQTIQNSVSSIANTVTLFLGSIAAISLLVGGVGVANTMFTSVMERTRQIGVLKSIGMANGEVMKLFLAESALIGLIGGVVGTIAGVFVSGIISGFSLGLPIGGLGRGRGMLTYVSPGLVLFAITFSVAIGALSGLFPARRASKMLPVEALRYE